MASQRILLLIPPLTQLNTPYPSTAYLTGFLESRGIDVEQADLGIEMVLRLFSRAGMTRVFNEVRKYDGELPPEAIAMLSMEQAYLDQVETVVSFLQGKT
ncbi:MAG: radical SAM protein, partial [Nitrospira sp.]|nr:radical SAM protein [Nitrospira sp.]